MDSVQNDNKQCTFRCICTTYFKYKNITYYTYVVAIFEYNIYNILYELAPKSKTCFCEKSILSFQDQFNLSYIKYKLYFAVFESKFR